jgi:hypothetical protein
MCVVRRMKTELLIQMDGLRGGKAGEQVSLHYQFLTIFDLNNNGYPCMCLLLGVCDGCQ